MTLTIETSPQNGPVRAYEMSFPTPVAFRTYARRQFDTKKYSYVLVRGEYPCYLIGVCGEKFYEPAFAKEE